MYCACAREGPNPTLYSDGRWPHWGQARRGWPKITVPISTSGVLELKWRFLNRNIEESGNCYLSIYLTRTMSMSQSESEQLEDCFFDGVEEDVDDSTIQLFRCGEEG